MVGKTIQPRKRGANIETLAPRMRLFVAELLADEQFNATRAAKKVGYKNPAMRAGKLLQDKRVQAILGKALKERIDRCQLTADEVLEHLRTALFLDPIDLFERTPEGGFVVRSLEDVPESVRRCITKIKQRQRIVGDSVETYVEVELMSKDSALQAAMKHLMLLNPDVSQTNINVGGVDFAAMLEEVENDRSTIDSKAIRRLAKE